MSECKRTHLTMTYLAFLISLVLVCSCLRVESVRSLRSLALVSISLPSGHANKTGYLKKLTGTCSEEGKSVRIFDNQAVVDMIVTCTSGAFTADVDTSGLATGTHSIFVSQDDVNGLTKVSDPLQLGKTYSVCDLAADRAKNFAAGLAGGTGTNADPYLICTADQLAEIAVSPSVSYGLANDIYFSNGDTNGDGVVDGFDTDYQTSPGWTPLPTFRGNFEGNNHTITDLYINLPATGGGGVIFYVGSFKYSEESSIS